MTEDHHPTLSQKERAFLPVTLLPLLLGEGRGEGRPAP